MNHILYKRADTLDELHQILHLQEQNLPESLTENEIRQEGFVTVHHDIGILTAMNDQCKHVIAKLGDRLVGYALCMHPNFKNDIPILKPMFDRIESVIDPTKSYMVMGQICIDKPFRGSGIFKGLYRFMKNELRADAQWIITEVDQKNHRSMNAHQHLGFKKLIAYQADGIDWELIYITTD
ncbi:MAG: GNAT family N-acetyltransferase [Flavobacteriaceae bacterium]|nr:GNAT family N-acetyltransferase [Flavobacteriaceae bacterium]